VIVIGLPIATPSEFKNDASFVFGNFENLYDWPNGFAFFLSFLAPLWSVGKARLSSPKRRYSYRSQAVSILRFTSARKLETRRRLCRGRLSPL
jgi:hypothetical protein